jgi:hypothetical protein
LRHLVDELCWYAFQFLRLSINSSGFVGAWIFFRSLDGISFLKLRTAFSHANKVGEAISVEDVLYRMITEAALRLRGRVSLLRV